MFLSVEAETLCCEIRARLPEDLPGRMGVAVSGGSDSIALMHLLHEIARQERIELHVVTVDHRLRPEAAAEAQAVAVQAAALGIAHSILKWDGWDGSGNLQDRARDGRYQLLTDWAVRTGIEAVAIGHTADDQAETVLMRLGRAAGVTGLSAMSYTRPLNGIAILRPMLSITRRRLRDYLKSRDIGWIDDPSNQDARFDRIKARQALSQLEDLGITSETLSRVAENLAQARDALARYTQETAGRIVTEDNGDLLIDSHAFACVPEEIARRLVVGCIHWIAGSGYPPRQGSVDIAMAAIRERKHITIGGCILLSEGEKARFCREMAAVQDLRASPGACWDNRWILSGTGPATAEVRALGENGLQQLTDWRQTGRPRAALLPTPAIWNDGELLAAPLAGFTNGWRAELRKDVPTFHTSLLSH